MTKEQKRFAAWCEAHPMPRNICANIFGCDVRTIQRYLSGTTQPHGGVMRLLDVFKRHPNIEFEMIKLYNQ